MAIIKTVVGHSPISRVINYITQDDKTTPDLVSGINCSPQTAVEEMNTTKAFYDKTDGRTYLHVIQSFSPDENIKPETAHRIAKEWAAQYSLFNGYEIVIATHIDRNHIHSHIVCNSVSALNGHKINTSAKDLENMKELSNTICKKYGYRDHDTRKASTKATAFNYGKYYILQQALRGEKVSYLWDTAVAVKDATLHSTSRTEFINFLKDRGYTVIWEDQRKYITFVNPEGKRVRDRNLKGTFNIDCSKESLEKQFALEKKEQLRQLQIKLTHYSLRERNLKQQYKIQSGKVEDLERRVMRAKEAIKTETSMQASLTLRRLGFADATKIQEAETELAQEQEKLKEMKNEQEFLDSAVEAEKAVFLDMCGDADGENLLLGDDELKNGLSENYGDDCSELNLSGITNELCKNLREAVYTGDVVKREFDKTVKNEQRRNKHR